MRTFSRLWTKEFWTQYPKYTPNFVDYIHSFNTLVEQFERRKLSVDLNNKRKQRVKIDRETESNEIFAWLDEVNSDLEDDIDNLMNVRILNLCRKKV